MCDRIRLSAQRKALFRGAIMFMRGYSTSSDVSQASVKRCWQTRCSGEFSLYVPIVVLVVVKRLRNQFSTQIQVRQCRYEFERDRNTTFRDLRLSLAVRGLRDFQKLNDRQSGYDRLHRNLNLKLERVRRFNR